MLKKIGLLALPVIAIIAIAGFASAYPWNVSTEGITQEEKDSMIQMLELRQEMLWNRIAYLKGELTQEQFEGAMQQLFDEMQQFREQSRSQGTGDGPCMRGYGKGTGFSRGMFGRGP